MDKKKKAAAAGAKAKPKGPGAKLLKAIKESQAKVEEEKRKQQEEEERLEREAQEALRAEEERLRLEKEKKEAKKLKEKLKKEQLRKEGKLLSKKQKADRARAQQSLQLLQQQGLAFVGKAAVPSISRVTKKDSTVNGVTKRKGADGEDDEASESLSHDEDDDEANEVEDEESEIEDWEELAVEKLKEIKVTAPSNGKKVNESVKLPQNKKEEVPTSSEPEIFAQPKAGSLRSPIICVLGHVDTGKTKLLDYLRKSHVQDNEAGGITQQIGATFVPPSAIHEQCKGVKKAEPLNMPGLLIIDTPGHESFTNLRSRGSSLCDIAILVVDIMHGLEPQTIESINLLKSRRTPFVVALNKIDRLYNWRQGSRRDIEDVIKSQDTNTMLEFDKRTKEVIMQLNQQSLNAALFYENTNPKEFVSLVPTSAHTGDGMGNIINLIIHYSQNMLQKRLLFDVEKLDATVLEVKAIPGLGTTIDVVLVNGFLREGDHIVLAGHDGPVDTHIRSLLVPQPLKELRIKTPYQELKVAYGSIGVKVTGQDLDRAVAGLELFVVRKGDDVEQLKKECAERFGAAMRAIKCSDKGVHVQASTLGSLEALLEFLKVSKIPYSGVRVGPVVKRDVMKASTMLESSPDHAIILAFDVKVEREAQELADQLNVKIFTAEIIYHLFDQFTSYQEQLKAKKKEQFKHLAVFPCKLRILPQFIFNTRNPIVLGVCVEDGIIVAGTPICVPSKGNFHLSLSLSRSLLFISHPMLFLLLRIPRNRPCFYDRKRK